MAFPSDPAPRRRALVTGLGGFTGRYVAAELEDAGFEVEGIAQSTDDAGSAMHVVDLCDRRAVSDFIANRPPYDAVVHLAAISFVAHGDPDAIYRVNVVGTRNLLEALDRAPLAPRVVVLASSANIYGNSIDNPIIETTAAAPANDYAVSKLAMEYMASLWAQRLPIVVARPFNYTGVGQSPQFLIPKIVDHFRRGAREIELGNIDVERDFSDVRDIARMYRALVEDAPIGQVFNLCSGVGHSLAYVLDTTGDIAGYRIAVKVNPALVRSSDLKRLVGLPRRIDGVAGEFRRRTLAQTLEWMFHHPG